MNGWKTDVEETVGLKWDGEFGLGRYTGRYTDAFCLLSSGIER